MCSSDLQGKAINTAINSYGHDVQTSRDFIADDESGRNVQRYIRLTHLIKPLLDLVDEGVLAMVAGVELSYLTPSEQGLILEFFFSNNNPMTITVPTAGRLRELAKEQELTKALLEETFTTKEKEQSIKKEVKIPFKKLKKIVPASYNHSNI